MNYQRKNCWTDNRHPDVGGCDGCRHHRVRHGHDRFLCHLDLKKKEIIKCYDTITILSFTRRFKSDQSAGPPVDPADGDLSINF